MESGWLEAIVSLLTAIGWVKASVSALAMFLATTVFSATGFGIGMVGTPLLLLVYDPQTAIMIPAMGGYAVGMGALWKSWRDIPFKEVMPIAVAALFGAPISVFILKTADSSVLTIGIAVLIILFAIASFLKVEREIPYSKPVGIISGFMVGLLLPTTGVAGSLVMLFLMTKKWERHSVRAGMLFFLMTLMSFTLILFGLYGLYTAERLVLGGVVAVPSVIGLILGTFLVKRINEQAFRYAVIGIIIVSAIMVLGKEVNRYL